MNIENKFKSALLRNERQIGLWLSLPDAYISELCATAGFDWLLLDSEHAPNDVRNILAQLQAVAPYRSQPVVRPANDDPALIKQLLDIGTQTLLVPMINTAEQARKLVSAVRYPPHGTRGVAHSVARASRWGLVADYMRNADHEICLLVQIETPEALKNIEEICAVDGIDGLFVGPADLSASLGHPGDLKHPDVRGAMESAVKRIIACDKPCGTLLQDPSLARHFLELGCSYVSVGIDLRLMVQATRALADAFINEPRGKN